MELASTMRPVCSADSSTLIEMCRVSSSMASWFLVVVLMAAMGPLVTNVLVVLTPSFITVTVLRRHPSLIMSRTW